MRNLLLAAAKKESPIIVLLLLLAAGASATASKKAVHAVITRKERIAPSSSFSDPIRTSTSALHTSTRKEVPLTSSPAFVSKRRRGATTNVAAPNLGASSTSCLETLRGGSDGREGDNNYYASSPDYYDDRDGGSGNDRGRGRGYDYDSYGGEGDDYYAPGRGEGGGDDYYERQDGGRDDYYYGRGDYGDQDRGYDYDDGRYQGDYGDYDDRGRRPSSKRRSSALSGMPNVMKAGNKKVGMVLLGGGTVLTFLGITLFFNKTLMRLGNLLFVAGVPMTVGPGRTMGFFLQPKKARATGCLGAGMFLVFVGWPILGICLEIFGLLNLFGNMFPALFAILKQFPIVGSLLGNSGGRSTRRGQGSRGNDDYYSGRQYQDDQYHDNDNNAESYY